MYPHTARVANKTVHSIEEQGVRLRTRRVAYRLKSGVEDRNRRWSGPKLLGTMAAQGSLLGLDRNRSSRSIHRDLLSRGDALGGVRHAHGGRSSLEDAIDCPEGIVRLAGWLGAVGEQDARHVPSL